MHALEIDIAVLCNSSAEKLQLYLRCINDSLSSNSLKDITSHSAVLSTPYQHTHTVHYYVLAPLSSPPFECLPFDLEPNSKARQFAD
jgi:hypothetical protein